MKIRFSGKYKNQQDAIKGVIKSFNNSGELFGNGDRNTIKLYTLNGIRINVKSFKIPHLINKIAYRFCRDSKAKRSFVYAQKLLSLGILTPYPIAYFEEKTSLFLLRSYYISEHQDYDLTFRELINDPKYIGNEAMLRAFTKFTFLLHEKGILFKDHSPGNTLIKINDTGYDFYLVDLNRMEFKPLDFETRIKNFAKLTPKREMIKVMANEYAKLLGEDDSKVFNKMWGLTKEFQEKYHKKMALKRKVFFWKQKYKNS